MIRTFQRYEKKLIITKEQFNNILPELEKRMEYDDYCLGGNMYPIQNIYFDDDSNSVIYRSIEKPYFKEKLRLRYYTDTPNQAIPVFLELKKKAGGIVFKRRALLTLKEAEEFLKTGKCPEGNSYMQRQVLSEIEYFLSVHNCIPKMHVSYDRLALVNRNQHNMRITFDSNIITRRENLSFTYPLGGKKLLPDGLYVMEIKVSDAIPLWLSDLLKENKAYISGFSKYGFEYSRYMKGYEEVIINV